MKILIDNSNLYAGGGIQVATSFLNDLSKLNLKYSFYVIQSYNSSKSINKNSFGNNFVFEDLDLTAQNSIKIRKKCVREIEARVTPDVIFTVFGPSYHKSKFPKVVGFAVGHILYSKSIYYKRIGLYQLFKTRLTNFIKDSFFRKNSDALVFETDDARNIYGSMIENKIPCYTVSNTLNSVFYDIDKWKKIDLIKSDFDILYLTANYLHKNIEIIPKIIDVFLYRDVNIKFKFHISCTKEELGFENKYDEYINYLGKVELEQVPSLYEKMDVLIMPTLLEIFSASYLEAMYMKVPIVASDLSFARDICGDAALYATCDDPMDYSNKLYSIYNSIDIKSMLINNGTINLERFGSSMDRTKKYLEILKKYAIDNATD